MPSNIFVVRTSDIYLPVRRMSVYKRVMPITVWAYLPLFFPVVTGRVMAYLY